MSELRTEIALDAPAERIWQLLSDFALYPQWNPLFVRAEGRALAGERLAVTVQLPSIPAFPIRPKLLQVEPNARLCWRHCLAFPALMSWSYGIELVALAPGRLKLVQSSAFGGLLGPLFSFALATAIEKGMDEVNRSLTRWGEKGNVQCLRC